MPIPHSRRFPALITAVLATLAAGCSTASSGVLPGAQPGGSGHPVIRVVAAENFWGSLAAQLGGDHVQVHQHHRQSRRRPARLRADRRGRPSRRRARSSSSSTASATTRGPPSSCDANPSPGRTVADGRRPGRGRGGRQPAPLVLPGRRPHGDRRDHRRLHRSSTRPTPPTSTRSTPPCSSTNLKAYFDLLSQIKASYAGTPVGASESIFALLARPLGLDLLTPAGVPDRDQRGHRPDRRGQGDDRRADPATSRSRCTSTTARTPPRTCSAQVDAARAAGHPGHHDHRDADPGRRLVPGLAGPPAPRARARRWPGDRRVSAPRARRDRPGHRADDDARRQPAPPAVDIEGAAVARSAAGTLWSGRRPPRSGPGSSSRSSARTASASRRCSRRSSGCCRWRPGAIRVLGRPAGRGPRARSATCRSGAASTPRCGSAGSTSSGSASTATGGAYRCPGAAVPAPRRPGWPR